ncbi:MAG: glycosyltransferase [Planctomycetota bacterium]|nr:glycosyltransferase [Planctomycetota bacterium]
MKHVYAPTDLESDSMPATIVIPQYRHHDLTLSCIRTLRECDTKRWPVIAVDDGSPDESMLSHIERLPHVTLLRQPHRGVTAAWNVGWQEAKTRWIVFLNNDTLSFGAWVDRLLFPLITGCVQMTGLRMRREDFLPRAVLEKLPIRHVLEGWCFAIGRSTLEQHGGFDSQLTTYWSDTDLQMRLMKNRQEHATLLALPDLPLEHLEHRTAHDPHSLPQRGEAWRADRGRFIAKWRRDDTPTS